MGLDMKKFTDIIKKMIAGREITVVLGIFTVIFAIRYMYILSHPVNIDEFTVFPYRKRTQLYLVVLGVLDILCFLQYKYENICRSFFLLINKIVNNFKMWINKMAEVVIQGWFKIALAVVLFGLISFGIYKDVAIQYDQADYRERVIPYISVCSLTGEIMDDTVIEQTFTTDMDEISGIYLRTATYARSNDSNIVITLLSMDGVLLGQESFSVLNASDNAFTYFGFQMPINIENVHQIKCQITAEGNAGGGNGITLYKGSADFYKEGELLINGSLSDGDCFLELLGNQKNSNLISSIYICVCIVIVIFLILSGYVLLKKRKIKLEYSFVIIALIVGSLFIFMMPPNSEHDGEAHFNTIYKYSNKILGYDVSGEPHEILKDEKDIFGQKFGYPASRGDYYSIKNILQNDSEYDRQQYEVNELGLEISDFPLMYIFSTIGLTLGRVLQINIIYIFYLTRFFNFLEYIIFTFFALKLMPVFKRTLFVIAILPMSLFQAASVSYDATVMGCSFLFVAICLYIMHNDLKKMYMMSIIILASCLFCIKSGAYFPLIGMLFCIPIGKRLNTKQRITFLIVFIACISFAAIQGFVDSGKTVSISEVAAVSENYPLTYSIIHPVWFAKMLCRTIYTTFEVYFKGLFGMSIFGIDTLSTPLILCVLVVAILFATKRQENNEATLYVSNWQRMIIVLCSVCSMLMVCFGTISWTPIGSDSIWGIQGRYFIPLLLPLMFLGCKSTNAKVKQPNNIVYCMCVMDGFYILFVLMQIFNV